MRLAAFRFVISGNHMLRRPKHSKMEVVTPKVEEDIPNMTYCNNGFAFLTRAH